jgi:hypothetical protein
MRRRSDAAAEKSAAAGTYCRALRSEWVQESLVLLGFFLGTVLAE